MSFTPAFTDQRAAEAGGGHGFILDFCGAITAMPLELHVAQRPQAEDTQQRLACPHKRIQTECHMSKSALCSDNVIKTAKWCLVWS